MAKDRSPTDDKARSYARERRGFAEYPHAFRGTWRKKKRAVEGSFRAKIRDELLQITGAPNEALLDTLAVHAIVRKRIRPWGSSSLREWVASRLARRVSAAGWNFFKEPYDGPKHRAPFTSFLESLVQGRSGRARELARLLASMLSPAAEQAAVRGSGWLAAFLEDEPAWKERLATWIHEVNGG